jgi:hypothetical protein
MSGPGVEYTGGCLCGAVRYRVTAEPLMTRVCWCRDCQYLGAGSGTVNVVFSKSAMTVTGALGSYRSVADSGNVMHRRFCTSCGTPVFSESEARPNLTIARAGTLDEPNRVAPAATIWTSSAPRWACIDGSLPQIAAQPPPIS